MSAQVGTTRGDWQRAAPPILEIYRALHAAGLVAVPLAWRTKDRVIGHQWDDRGQQVRTGWRWWQTHRPAAKEFDHYLRGRANLGILGGAVSGVAWLDADTPADLAALRAAYPDAPWVNLTAHGGHVAFSYPAGLGPERIPNRCRLRIELPNGRRVVVDVRGHGAFIVGPGSTHPGGHVYTPTRWPWVAADRAALPQLNPAWKIEVDGPAGPRETTLSAYAAGAAPPTTAPARLPLAVEGEGKGEGNLRRGLAYAARVGPAIAGQGGNARTYRLACALVRDLGLADAAAREVLGRWNATCEPPWADRELDAFLAAAHRYGKHAYAAPEPAWRVLPAGKNGKILPNLPPDEPPPVVYPGPRRPAPNYLDYRLRQVLHAFWRPRVWRNLTDPGEKRAVARTRALGRCRIFKQRRHCPADAAHVEEIPCRCGSVLCLCCGGRVQAREEARLIRERWPERVAQFEVAIDPEAGDGRAALRALEDRVLRAFDRKRALKPSLLVGWDRLVVSGPVEGLAAYRDAVARLGLGVEVREVTREEAAEAAARVRRDLARAVHDRLEREGSADWVLHSSWFTRPWHVARSGRAVANLLPRYDPKKARAERAAERQAEREALGLGPDQCDREVGLPDGSRVPCGCRYARVELIHVPTQAVVNVRPSGKLWRADEIDSYATVKDLDRLEERALASP